MEIRQLPGRFRGIGLAVLIYHHITPEFQTVSQIMVRMLKNERPAIHPQQLSAECRENLRNRITAQVKTLAAEKVDQLETKVHFAPNTTTPTRYVRKT